MESLREKVALVTGAASGIGLACVARFVREGARVVGLDLTEPHDDLDVPDGSSAVSFVQADVRDEDAIAAPSPPRLPSTAGSTRSSTAAGVAGGGPAHSSTATSGNACSTSISPGTFLVCKHAIAHMLEQPLVNDERGSIVTIASVEGLEGTAGGSSYNASKGAVVIFTKNLAIDYGRSGIRANVDLPRVHRDADARGRVRDAGPRSTCATRSARSTSSAGSVDPRRSRPSPPFLVSSDASFVTGQAIAVDGGYTAGRDHGVTKLLGL